MNLYFLSNANFLSRRPRPVSSMCYQNSTPSLTFTLAVTVFCFFSGSFCEPVTQLSLIRNLADLDIDGKMDRLEFSIAMKLIKLKLQGRSLPPSLPLVMKQSPGSGSAVNIPTSARFGNKKNTFL